jgi:hypothetical protein
MTIAVEDIRSKAVPLYELLTYGRMDQSGDFCEGARLSRDKALAVIMFVMSIRIDRDDNVFNFELAPHDRAAIAWIKEHMPKDGSELK